MLEGDGRLLAVVVATTVNSVAVVTVEDAAVAAVFLAIRAVARSAYDDGCFLGCCRFGEAVADGAATVAAAADGAAIGVSCSAVAATFRLNFPGTSRIDGDDNSAFVSVAAYKLATRCFGILNCSCNGNFFKAAPMALTSSPSNNCFFNTE